MKAKKKKKRLEEEGRKRGWGGGGGGGKRLEEAKKTPQKTPAREARRFGDPVRESGRLALFPG